MVGYHLQFVEEADQMNELVLLQHILVFQVVEDIFDHGDLQLTQGGVQQNYE